MPSLTPFLTPFLGKIPHSQLESVVNEFKGPTDDELIDYLLKSPMEIRKSKWGLIYPPGRLY